ncbi:hypothetical protein CQA49_04260, partial [Helicobacter sp. MIT 00-7814]|uniref:hypothetical protein n=1 Tax=unclassified Helicobacter TaxID=2593540 RepID=UPI000E36F99A
VGINEVKIFGKKGSQMNLGNAILQMEGLKLAYRKGGFWDFFKILNKIPKISLFNRHRLC